MKTYLTASHVISSQIITSYSTQVNAPQINPSHKNGFWVWAGRIVGLICRVQIYLSALGLGLGLRLKAEHF